MIKRERYMQKVRPFIDKEVVKVITGIRRSGKSVMLELIKEELLERGVSSSQFISINFENMSYAHLNNASALHEYILDEVKNVEGKVYLFFDEIQEVNDWEKCINSFRVEFDCDIYITGSNAKLLSSELATYLAGRYVEFVIYPFSFEEFIEQLLLIEPHLNAQECFKKYLLLGGMPYLGQLNYDINASKQYLSDLYNSVELKDIVKRNNIRDVDLLERLLGYMTMNIGTTFSANSISKYLKNEGRKLTNDTVLNYINYAINSFLVYKAGRIDVIGKKVLAVNEKYYIADQGIREALYGTNTKDIQLVLENIVFIEMLRRGYRVYVGKVDNKEIDFIGERQNERIYIQVSYMLGSEETIEREFGVYSKVLDNYPKYVVTMDELDFSQNGILHMNIRDFLLKENW